MTKEEIEKIDIMKHKSFIIKMLQKMKLEITDEIIQVGFIGLLKGMRKYEYNKEGVNKAEYMTYSYFYIKHEILEFTNDDGQKLSMKYKLKWKEEGKYQTIDNFNKLNRVSKSDGNIEYAEDIIYDKNYNNIFGYRLDEETFKNNIDKYLSCLDEGERQIIEKFLIDGKIIRNTFKFNWILKKIKENFGSELEEYKYLLNLDKNIDGSIFY